MKSNMWDQAKDYIANLTNNYSFRNKVNPDLPEIKPLEKAKQQEVQKELGKLNESINKNKEVDTQERTIKKQRGFER